MNPIRGEILGLMRDEHELIERVDLRIKDATAKLARLQELRQQHRLKLEAITAIIEHWDLVADDPRMVAHQTQCARDAERRDLERMADEEIREIPF